MCDHHVWQAGTHANFLKSVSDYRFVLQDSNVTFENNALMTLSNPFVKLVGNNFNGNGSIRVGTGEDFSALVKAEVAGNNVDGVRLLFGGINDNDENVLMRNNEVANHGSLSLRSGSPQGCDAGNSGRSVGCDHRAECTAATLGVQCSCLTPLQAVKGEHAVFDGSLCALKGQMLDIFEQSKAIDVFVPKPQDSNDIEITLVGTAEETFSATFSSSAAFMEILSNSSQPLQGNRTLFEMSTARPERSQTLFLRVSGKKVPWADNEFRSETILVRAPQAITTRLDVSVHVKPWGSCEHTEVKLGSITRPLKHEGGDKVQLMLTARDSDNLVITKMELNFEVSWVYLDSSSTKAKGVMVQLESAGKYTATVPQELMTRAGWYRIDVRLLMGWNGGRVVESCALEQWKRLPEEQRKLYIECAAGFEPDALSNECVKDVFNKKCEEAKVSMDGNVLAKGTASAQIGQLALLSVSLASNASYFYRYYPLKNIQERPLSSDLKVEVTGSFHLQLVDNRTHQSCELLSKLEVSCVEGFELGKHNKCTAVESNMVQLVVGGLVGALFAAGLLSLIVYAHRDPERFKKLIGSFLLNEITVILSICCEIWDFSGD